MSFLDDILRPFLPKQQTADQASDMPRKPFVDPNAGIPNAAPSSLDAGFSSGATTGIVNPSAAEFSPRSALRTIAPETYNKIATAKTPFEQLMAGANLPIGVAKEAIVRPIARSATSLVMDAGQRTNPEAPITPTGPLAQFFYGNEPVKPLHQIIQGGAETGGQVAEATLPGLKVPGTNKVLSDYIHPNLLKGLGMAFGGTLAAGGEGLNLLPGGEGHAAEEVAGKVVKETAEQALKHEGEQAGETVLADVAKSVKNAPGIGPGNQPVRSWEDVMKFARENPQSAETLLKHADAIQHLDAVNSQFITHSNALDEEMGRLQAEAKADPTKAADNQAKIQALHDQQQELLLAQTQSRAEYARALNASKMQADKTMDPNYWLGQGQKEAGRKLTLQESEGIKTAIQNGDKDALAKQIASLHTNTFGEKALDFWRTNLMTLAIKKKVLGDSIQAVMERTKDVPATMVDALFGRFVNKEPGVTSPLFLPSVLEKKEVSELVKPHYDEAFPADKYGRQVNYGPGKVAQTVQSYTQGVKGMFGAVTGKFGKDAFERSLYEQARTQAARGENLVGDELETRVRDLLQNPSKQMLERAKQEAETATFSRQTFTGKMLQTIPEGFEKAGKYTAAKAAEAAGKTKEEAAQIAQRAGANARAVGRFLTPFTTTPGAITHTALEYSPAGIANVIKAAQMGDRRAFAQSLGRVLTGLGILGTGYAGGKSGAISGATPSKAADKIVAGMTQEKPAAVNLGGLQVGLSQAGPLGDLLAAAADVSKTQGSVGSKATAGIESLMRMIANTSSITGINRLTAAWSDPQKFLPALLKQYAGSVVPSVVGGVARAIDTTQRETNTPGQAVLSRIPGLSQLVSPALNPLGQPIQNPRGLQILSDFVTPPLGFRNNSPETQKFQELNQAGFPVSPAQVPDKPTIAGVQFQLDPRERNQIQQAIGNRQRDFMLRQIQNPAFNALAQPMQQKFLQREFDRIHTEVQDQMLAPKVAKEIHNAVLKSKSGDAQAQKQVTSFKRAGVFKNPAINLEVIRLGNQGIIP